VPRPAKAWTQANFNPQCVSAELCAAPLGETGPCGANWSRAEWLRHTDMLQNTADWIREECQHFGLPIVKLSASQAQGSGRGVAGHVDLGAGGGGHHDPGPNFPWSEVMDLARRGSPAPPQPLPLLPQPQPPKEEDIVSVATGVNASGALHVFVEAKDGSVWYTWQKKGETSWEGGEKGKSVAKLQPFAPAPK